MFPGAPHASPAAALDWQEIGGLATSVGVILTLLVLWMERRRTARLLRTEHLVKAQDKYDQICALRAANPQYSHLAAAWQAKPFAKMSKEELSYNHYVEMTLGLVETYVYLTFRERAIPEQAFYEFIYPMIWLEVAQNRRAFAHYAAAKSISELSCAFLSAVLQEMKKSGVPEDYSPALNVRDHPPKAYRYGFTAGKIAAMQRQMT